MNPTIDKLPVPDMNVPGAPNKAPTETALSQNPEKSLPAESLSHGGAGQSRSATMPDPSALAAPAGQIGVAPMAPSTPIAGTQAASDDDTAIEKEYINKAKAIVGQTGTDPFVQAREIGKVKAEFLKRRYGKEIRLDGGE